MKRRPTYPEIDREELPPGNPIHMAVPAGSGGRH
jgi:hypothetical protein